MSAGGLEAVFLANRDKLLRFLRARGAADSAEDLVQELWIKAAGMAAGPIADPLSYLYRAANNLMLDRHRAATRAARRDNEWHDSNEGALAGASEAPSPERLLAARERLAEAERTLESLGSRVASVFRLYRIDGVGQRDIAAHLGISLSAVEKDLQKAYRAIAELGRRQDAE